MVGALEEARLAVPGCYLRKGPVTKAEASLESSGSLPTAQDTAASSADFPPRRAGPAPATTAGVKWCRNRPRPRPRCF